MRRLRGSHLSALRRPVGEAFSRLRAGEIRPDRSFRSHGEDVFERLTRHLRSIFDTESSGRLILYAPLVGIVAGLAAAGFYCVLNATEALLLGQVVGYYPPSSGDELVGHVAQMPVRSWAVVLVPTVGGLLCGLLVYGLAPEAEGHGTK